MNTADKFLESWEEGQQHLEQYWELCKNQYLQNLKEGSQLFNKHPRGQSVKEPTIGDIVQVKDSTPRGRWRVGNAIKIMGSQNEKKQTADMLMPNKNILRRSIIYLYPLERNEEKESNESSNKVNSNQKVSCKGENLKNHGFRTDMHQGDKIHINR